MLIVQDGLVSSQQGALYTQQEPYKRGGEADKSEREKQEAGVGETGLQRLEKARQGVLP